MSKAQKQAKLLRRVQQQHRCEQSFALGCDRSTVSHIPNNGNDITDTSKRIVFSSVHDRYARRWAAKRAANDRIMIELSPFCAKCSRKYLKQVRTAECECE